MSEICFDCFNEIMEGKEDKSKYIISKELYLCEECGEYKPVVVVKKRSYHMRRLRRFLFPFWLIYMILYVIWRILLLPYLIYQHQKIKRTTKTSD